MRKLIEYDHLSIDGRISGDGFWAAQMAIPTNDQHLEYQRRLLEPAVGLVLGRETYEGFAATWPSMTGGIADTLNSLPKHVASTTLTATTWNAEVLAGDAVDAVARLKESGDGTLVKYGNGPFSRALVEAGLLDELHLLVHPIAVRKGMRLFDEGDTPIPLTLLSSQTFRTGVLNLVYAPAESAPEGTYEDAKVHLNQPEG